MGGAVNTDGNNLPWGNARSIGQQLTQQDIEDFINQPELFRQLLQPIIELEGARAQAELDNINDKLYASFDEEVPEEYRDLVQEYIVYCQKVRSTAETVDMQYTEPNLLSALAEGSVDFAYGVSP